MENHKDDLVHICVLLKKNDVNFVVIGARACAFHGHIRATEDLDFLIQNDKKNIENAIQFIKELYPHLQEEITVEDFYLSIVIKILDEPEIDISLSAWSVTYEESQNDICKIIIDGVEIPFLGIESLIKSKNTEREIDKWDIKVLREIQNQKRKN